MFLLEQDGKYIDVYERAVYNAMLSGLSLKGDTLLLPESAAVARPARAQPVVRVRLLPEQPAAVHAVDSRATRTRWPATGCSSTSSCRARRASRCPAATFALEQQTRLPVGRRRQDLACSRRRKPGRFTLAVRVPGWSHGPSGSGRPLSGPRAGPRARVTLKRERACSCPIRPRAGLRRHRRATGRPATPSTCTCRCRSAASSPTRRSRPTKGAWRSSAGRWSTRPSSSTTAAASRTSSSTTRRRSRPQWRPDLLGGVTVVTGKATAYRTRHGDGGHRRPCR